MEVQEIFSTSAIKEIEEEILGILFDIEYRHRSIFDLLWVREFNIEIHVEADYVTYNGETECLDWTKYDFIND